MRKFENIVIELMVLSLRPAEHNDVVSTMLLNALLNGLHGNGMSPVYGLQVLRGQDRVHGVPLQTFIKDLRERTRLWSSQGLQLLPGRISESVEQEETCVYRWIARGVSNYIMSLPEGK